MSVNINLEKCGMRRRDEC